MIKIARAEFFTKQGVTLTATLIAGAVAANSVQAANPVAALEAFRANPSNFDLIFTDLSMPEMTGINLAKALLEIRLDLPVVLATGYGASSAIDAYAVGIKKVISKPVDPRTLPSLFAQLLNGKRVSKN